jgi:aldehyde dehydrogenase
MNEELIRSVVKDVLTRLGPSSAATLSSNGQAGHDGVYTSVDEAVQAAQDAQQEFERRGIDDRKTAIDCIRRICIEQAEELGQEELEETKIGRLEHKIEKLVVAGTKAPGTEFLQTQATSGGNGLTLTEYAPFGVIGAITPVTHSLPTLAGNAINMLAGGNAVVINPHPSGARIAAKGVQLFNRAIASAIGIENLIVTIETPTLESAQAIFDHRDVRLLVVTGGPAVARAALRSPKRAIVAGPGNPPVVIDETADLERAARSVVAGASYDNNLLCIAEKELFVVESVFDEFMEILAHHHAVRLSPPQIEALTKQAFTPGDKGHLLLNKDLVGQDAAMLAEVAGLKIPASTLILYGETDESHPFVDHEQMMPFLPVVRARDVQHAIALAKEYEHGYRHTAIIHSRNVETMTFMGREMDVTIYVQNGPCMAGLGLGGEGYLSFSIATPTGEGVTNPMTFTRQRRSAIVGSMRVV